MHIYRISGSPSTNMVVIPNRLLRRHLKLFLVGDGLCSEACSRHV
jgi:hypothetical protein